MISPRAVALAVLGIGLGLGAVADRAPATPPPVRDGRLVVQADFHVHAFFGDGAIPPWNLGREARRRGLHALAITNHNQVFAARLGRWWNRLWGGPLVLVGQEVTNPTHHIIAVGLRQAVDWRGPPATIIDDIHAQGALAIAAHPDRYYIKSFDPVALRKLDGAERAHPLIFSRPEGQAELDQFVERARPHRDRPLAEIGSSDFHTMSTLGRCRTLVMARELSEQALLEAIAEGRTIALASGATAPDVPLASTEPALGLGGVLGWLGLLGLLFAPGRRRPRTDPTRAPSGDE